MRIKYHNFLEGRVLGRIILMALPLLAIVILNSFSNTLSTTFVGRHLGTNALASVGIANGQLSLVNIIASALGIATAVVCATAYGSGNKKRHSKSVHMSMLVAFVLGTILTIVAFIKVSKGAFMRINTPASIIDFCMSYGRICALQMFGSCVFYAALGIMYAVGDTLRPMFLCIFKFVHELIFYFIWAMTRTGIAGLAWCSVVPVYIAAGLAFMVLCISRGSVRFSFRYLFRFGLKELLYVVAITVAAALQSGALNSTTIAMQSVISGFGAAVVAANAVANNVASYISTIGSVFIVVVLVTVAQAAGALNSRRALRNALISGAVALVPTLHTALFVGILKFPLMRTMPGDPEILHMASGMATMLIFSALLLVLINIIAAAIRAHGFNFTAFLLSGGVYFIGARISMNGYFGAPSLSRVTGGLASFVSALITLCLFVLPGAAAVCILSRVIFRKYKAKQLAKAAADPAAIAVIPGENA